MKAAMSGPADDLRPRYRSSPNTLMIRLEGAESFLSLSILDRVENELANTLVAGVLLLGSQTVKVMMIFLANG